MTQHPRPSGARLRLSPLCSVGLLHPRCIVQIPHPCVSHDLCPGATCQRRALEECWLHISGRLAGQRVLHVFLGAMSTQRFRMGVGALHSPEATHVVG